MKTRFLVLVLAGFAAATVFGKSAKSGSCISKAHTLKSSQRVTLVEEYDPEEDDKEDRFLGTGAAYYKMTLKRGQAYTVWITGGNAADMSLDVGTNWEYYDKDAHADKEPGADFEIFEIDGGDTQVAYLYAEDWDMDSEEGDPKSGKYIVYISGDSIGMSTTLGFTTGIKEFAFVGTEDNPKVISMAKNLRTYSGRLVDGEFNFRTTLKAGHKYRIRTVGGKKSAELSLDVGSAISDNDSEDEEDNAEWIETDTARKTAYNDALVVMPEATGPFSLVVTGDPTQSFKLQYQMVPTRAITAHPTIPLLAETGYCAKFVPGRMVNTQNYYDGIIDDNLCKIYLVKGEMWAFETEGATKPQQMIAYGPTGSVLRRNTSMGRNVDGSDSYDTRVVITASATGLYYVGVCDPNLDVSDKPTGDAVTLTARCTSHAIPADDFDPADNDRFGASVIVPYPATTNDWASLLPATNAQALALGAIHGPHRLDAGDLYDTFAFACRKGYTYKVRAELDNPDDDTPFTLAAKVFNMNGAKERNVAYTGTLTPETRTVVFSEDDLTFKANTNAVHYVRVWINEGAGLDFPAYRLKVIAANGTNDIALVGAVSEGADGTWSVNTEKFTYLPGTTLTLATNASITIKANAVKGFTAPAAQTVTPLLAWSAGDPVVIVTNRYTDIYDAKYQTGTKTVTKKGKKTTEKVYSPEDGDATPAGAFAIAPAAAAATLKRTLWKDDPADHFTFNSVTNVYYNFKVASTLPDGSGDAVITVSNATAGVVGEYTNVTEITRALLPVGTTYVIVSHGTDEKADSAYAFTFSKASGGIVRFTNAKGVATSSYVVNETAAAATLYVARTGSEGAARVIYATQAGTAIPGTNYFPVVTNEVKWAAGDKAVKAIKVNLIPEPTAAWSSSNLTFSVKLLPVDEYALADGEYLAIIPSDTATVTIKNTSAKKPGTVSLALYGDDVAVANTKKPAVTGTAGTPLRLTFTRTGGADGPVSVKVASPTAAVAKKNKDTALAGADYEAFDETLAWADGEDDAKTVTVNLLSSANYAASKKFIFTIAAVKTDGTLPTLAAKTATATILNDTVAQTSAAYAKTIAAATGLKLVTTGTWFNDYDGTLRSGAVNGTLTYTLTGPGFFACEPSVVLPDPSADAATLTCQIVNKTAKLNETVTDFSSRLVRIIPAGTTTVKFTLSSVTGGAYVKFAPQTDGAPYVWGRFADVSPAAWSKAGAPALMNKAVVKKENVQTLAWTLPAALATESNLYCRVRFGTTAKPTEIRGYDKDHEEAVPPEDRVYEVGTTYYWALDYAYTEAESPSYDDLQALAWTPGPTTWSFSTLKDGAPITALDDDGDPSNDPKDMAGNDVAELIAHGEPIELIQGVNVKSLVIVFDGDGEGEAAVEANKFRVVGGTLPKGVTINATTGLLDGAPTTPGTYTALLQGYNQTGKTVTKKVKGKSKKVTTYTYTYGTTVPVSFEVLPAGSMIGSFRGALVEDGSTFASNTRHVGNLTLTTTSAGKITAKVALAGVTYTFSGKTGFDELLDRDETLPGCTRHVQVRLQAAVKTINSKKKVTGTYKENYLTLTLGDGALTNAVALAEAVGTAELMLSVLNAAKTAVTPDVAYKADLYRNNGATDLGKAAMADFAGYYTMALVPENVSAADGVPVGNGYLTFTVAQANTVKVTGSLADGTSVSFSTIGQLVGDSLETPRGCALFVPLYVGNSAYALAGTVKIAYGSDDADALPVVQPAQKLVWMKNASATTSRDKAGFAIDIAPTGGWFNKIVNLQNYYLGRSFAITTIEGGNDLPAEALAKGYSFTTLSAPNNLDVSFVGNTLTAAARKLVKNKTTGLSDFGTSVNPWNTKVKLNRTTGLVTGTFNAWEWVLKSDLLNEYATAQKQITSLAHKGVLLFARDDSTDSPLADNVLTAGFFLMPATNSTKAKVKKAAWKASLPFNIICTDDESEPSWDEREDLDSSME